MRVRVKRGEGVTYVQDGEKSIDDFEPLTTLYRLFDEKPWKQIRETLFKKGAEDDPTGHL